MNRIRMGSVVRLIGLITALTGFVAGAHADATEDQKAQLEALTRRVELLEQKAQPREVASAASAPARARGNLPRLPFGYGFQFLEYPGQ
jgi:hypothetical protein